MALKIAFRGELTLAQLVRFWTYSLVGAGAGLDWLVLVFYERKTLLAG